MFPQWKKKEKVGTAKLTDRLVRLMRPDSEFQISPISLGETDQNTNCDRSQRDAANAMLEAENRRAKAIMAMHQHRSFL